MKKLSILMLAASLYACGGGGGGDSAPDLSNLQAGKPTSNPGKGLGKGLGKGGSASATAPLPDPAPAPMPPDGTVPLGVNLEGLSDYARIPLFADAIKTSRRWGPVGTPWDENAPTDANGWPTGDASLVVTVMTSDDGEPQGQLAQGVWRLKWTGNGTVQHIASAGVTITSQVCDATSCTADVNVGAGAYQLVLSWTGTGNGVRNVTLMRPGYADGAVWTNEFRQAIAPFRTLRFMDFLSTNGTPVTTWASRTLPTSASQATGKGGAYEYAIQMANEFGKDIWLNIPQGADDDHIRQLATLLKDKLAPGRVVYLEYSNELWNWLFPQSSANLFTAQAEAVAGDTTLTGGVQCSQAEFDAGNGSDCNKYWAAHFRVAKRAVAISQIFGEVMGSAALNTRFRPVLAMQWAYRAIGEQQLKYMALWHGAPSGFIHGIAGAPYFNLTQAEYESTSMTSTQILDALQRSVDTEYAPAFKATITYDGNDWSNSTQQELAKFYGIKSLAYEGGLDMGQSAANSAAKMAAVKDARMGAIAKSELDQWFACGNDLFLYYSLSSGWGQWGYWGLTNNGSNLDTPRYNAAKAVAESAPATVCR
jgi:hypothetical protein